MPSLLAMLGIDIDGNLFKVVVFRVPELADQQEHKGLERALWTDNPDNAARAGIAQGDTVRINCPIHQPLDLAWRQREDAVLLMGLQHQPPKLNAVFRRGWPYY